MKLEDIRNNPAIMKYLRWDLDKEKLARQKETFDKEDAGFYFCIYVRNYRACLALLHYYPDGKATQDYILGFPEDMILEVVKEMGGAVENNQIIINGGRGGVYLPVSKPIEDILRLGLITAKKKKGE